jgi:hypothetical protein
MRSYVKTRGGYNPEDEEETSLNDYYNKFTAISRRAENLTAPEQSPMPMPRPGDAPTGLLNIAEAPIVDPASQGQDAMGMLAMAGATPPAGGPATAVLGGGVGAAEGTSLDRLGAPKVRITKARGPASMPTQMPMPVPDQASLAKRMMLALSGRQSPLEQARAGMLLRAICKRANDRRSR